MLYTFGFDRIGVLLSDLYIVDPEPIKGQEGPEHGVRLELRVLDREELRLPGLRMPPWICCQGLRDRPRGCWPA